MKYFLRISYLAYFLALFILAGLSQSCSKSEGYGGNSTIKGQVNITVYNTDFSLFLFEKPAGDEDVFILFDKDLGTGDDVKTDFDGRFGFSGLLPGNYTIYIYTMDTTSPYLSEKELLFEINLERNETVDLGTINMLKTIEWDNGSAIISGQVFLINYYNSTTWPYLVVKDTSYAQEKEVYLEIGIHGISDERIRTRYDGTFEFPNLIPGNYKVYLYSEDVTGATQDIVKSFDVQITQEFQQVDLGVISIEQL
jgi:hypothetical protein